MLVWFWMSEKVILVGVCEENITNISHYAVNRPKNRGHFGNQMALIVTPKNHDFGCIDI